MNKTTPWWAASTETTKDTKSSTRFGRKGVFYVVLSFMLIIASMVVFLIVGPDPQAVQDGDFGSRTYPADTESLIAGCGDTFTFSPEQNNYGALPDDFFVDPNGPLPRKRTVPNHPMIVPAYGYFINDPSVKFSKKFYTLKDLPVIETPVDRLPGLQRVEYLKMMWNGYKIIWYMDEIDQQTKDAIKTYVSERDDVVAMPWTSDVALPMGRSFGFSAWNVTRSCNFWDSDVASKFVSFADDYNAGRNKSDIPAVKLDSDGEAELIRVEK